MSYTQSPLPPLPPQVWRHGHLLPSRGMHTHRACVEEGGGAITFQPVPNSAVISIVHGWTGGPDEVNDYVFRKASGFTDEDIELMLDAADAVVVATGYIDFVPDGAKVRRTYGRILSEEFAVGHSHDVDEAGTYSSTFLPPNNAAWVKFMGTSGDPPRHGGVFWPFVAEGSCGDTGLLTSGFRTALNEVVSVLTGAIEGATTVDSDLVLVSRYGKSAWIAAHPDATPEEIDANKPWIRPQGETSVVTGIATRELIASQRDRRG